MRITDTVARYNYIGKYGKYRLMRGGGIEQSNNNNENSDSSHFY